MHVIKELRDEKLDFWIQNNLNVLFIGHYGTGKTTRILEAFKRNKLRYKYFSAATMDPWCDFVGVPKVVNDDNGPYLDYVLPRDLRDDSVEAICMDELNRSHKKVRNALMELLQFKSINGRPFHKLRLIWAMINPEDEGQYQVEVLDKAQKDRFHIQIAVPYEPSIEYFTKKYDVKQAKSAIEWWKTLSAEDQMEVSPRRLDYALQIYNLPGGNLKDVLPHFVNPSKLLGLLKNGPVDEKLKEIFAANDIVAAKKFLQGENNFGNAVRYLVNEIPTNVNKEDWMLFFLTSTPAERIQSLLATEEVVYNFILNNFDKVPIFDRIIKDTLAADTDKNLVRRIRKQIGNFGQVTGQAEKPHFSKKTPFAGQWSIKIKDWMKMPMATTPQRMSIYEELASTIPSTLTLAEAVDTLEMINLLAARSHADTLKQYTHLMGTINHCVEQINKASNLSWLEIVTNYGQKFNKLLDKLRDSGMDKKLLCPSKQPLLTPGYSPTP